MNILAALAGSRAVLYALGLLTLAGAYEGWKYHQRSIGAAKITAAIEKKGDDNAKLADAVRNDVAAGKRGVRGKYERPGD